MYQNQGLVYRMIDDEGKKIGAPIKASAFQNKATLKDLERRYPRYLAQEARAVDRLKPIISRHCLPTIGSLGELRKDLYRDKVLIVIPSLFERPTRKKAPCQTKPTATPTHTPPATPLPTLTTQPALLDDGHGFFYIDLNHYVALRDTQLGPEYTAAEILKTLKLDKSILQLIDEQKLAPRPADLRLLQSSDPQKVRKAILRLTLQHNQFKEKQKQTQRQAPRHSLRLGF